MPNILRILTANNDRTTEWFLSITLGKIRLILVHSEWCVNANMRLSLQRINTKWSLSVITRWCNPRDFWTLIKSERTNNSWRAADGGQYLLDFGQPLVCRPRSTPSKMWSIIKILVLEDTYSLIIFFAMTFYMLGMGTVMVLAMVAIRIIGTHFLWIEKR